ncbi:MAG: hypothetical protein Q4G09_03475 [Clostridia bacterium]|nr:hypothetical protein [Clostridia bacterium]
METLKNIIDVLKIIGISIAGITFIIFMIKIAVEPEYKAKYIKYTKHLLIATIFITLSLSIVELPKNYYGSKIEIVDSTVSETTIAELKDKDCQGRETLNVDGKWYVVTDSGWNLQALTEDSPLIQKIKTLAGYEYNLGKYEVNNVSVLRLFSECQGTFKGYFANYAYYRDSDGLIFPATYTYSQYQSAKANSRRRWL